MSDNDKVIEYLKSRRKSVESGSTNIYEQDILESYKKILDSCTKYEDNLPTLIVCETYDKYSDLLPILKGDMSHKFFVVYDLHLERVINRFMTVLLSDVDSAHDVWKLAYSLFGEEMILKENELLAFYYKLNDIGLGDYEIEINETDEIRLMCEVQRSYILAHEVGHWMHSIVYENNSKRETDILNITDTVDNIMVNSKELLIEIYEGLEKKYYDKAYSPLINEQKKIVYDNDRIINECFADAIAYSYIVSFVNTEYGTVEARIIAVKSLYILMLTMQILAMCHMTFNDESFENSFSIRIIFLREYLIQYYEDISKEYQEEISALMERYENRITNIILESFSELEKRGINISDAFSEEDDT